MKDHFETTKARRMEERRARERAPAAHPSVLEVFHQRKTDHSSGRLGAP